MHIAFFQDETPMKELLNNFLTSGYDFTDEEYELK